MKKWIPKKEKIKFLVEKNFLPLILIKYDFNFLRLLENFKISFEKIDDNSYNLYSILDQKNNF